MAAFGCVNVLGKETKSANTAMAAVNMVTGEEAALRACLKASIMEDQSGPLMPPSLRILQKCTDIRITRIVGMATQCKI